MKRFGCAINYYIVDLLNIWKDSSPETFAVRRDEYLAAANASADSPFCQLDYTRMTKMADFIKRRVDSITCENEMKMEIFFREEQPAFIDDEVNTAMFDFSYADRIYAFACEHGLDVRIHTVLWYNHVPRQLKEYLAGRSEADRKRLTLAFLKAFMQCLRERYPKGYCVDVINEMAADPDELRYMAEEGEPGYEYDEDGIRIDFWYRTLGKDYYLEVLRLAREVFGDDVKLVYNDNNEGNREKQKTVQTVVEKCKTYERETGIRLLDALGMQCHFWGSKEETKEFMEQFFAFYKSLGLELQVTEFDVSNHSTKEIQERIFRDFIEVAPKYGVENFTMWALNDLVSWYAADEPTLVDRDGNEKPVAAKYVEAFAAKGL